MTYSWLKKTAFLISLLILFGIGAGLVIAQFAPPTLRFPGNNVAAPITATGADQVREGVLEFGTSGATSASGAKVVVDETSGSGTQAEQVVVDGTGNATRLGMTDIDRTVDIVAGSTIRRAGELRVSSTIFSTSLRPSIQSQTYNPNVCALSDGTIVLCNLDESGRFIWEYDDGGLGVPSLRMGHGECPGCDVDTFIVPEGATNVTVVVYGAAGGGGGGGSGDGALKDGGAGGQGGEAPVAEVYSFAVNEFGAPQAGDRFSITLGSPTAGGNGGGALTNARDGISGDGHIDENGTWIQYGESSVFSGTYGTAVQETITVIGTGGRSGDGGAQGGSSTRNGAPGEDGGDVNENYSVGGLGGEDRGGSHPGDDGEDGWGGAAGGGGGGGGPNNRHSGGNGGTGTGGRIEVSWE